MFIESSRTSGAMYLGGREGGRGGRGDRRLDRATTTEPGAERREQGLVLLSQMTFPFLWDWA